MIQNITWAVYAFSFLSLLTFEIQMISSAQRHSLIENQIWRRVVVSAAATLLTGAQVLNGLDWPILELISSKAAAVTVGAMLIAGLLFPNAANTINVRKLPLPIYAIALCISLNMLTTAAALLPAL